MTTKPGGSQHVVDGLTHYQRNSDKYKKRTLERREQAKECIRKAKTGPCVDCGLVDPRVMEFDHLPHHEKRATVANMPTMGYSVASIEEEIAKCELVCANCHRIRTWERNHASMV